MFHTRYYGLSMWFPEYIKLLKQEEYNAGAVVRANENYHGVTFNDTLDNVKFVNASFTNVTFSGMVLNHVTFTNCKLRNCEFRDVMSSRTFFVNSSLIRNHFVDTDLYPYRRVQYILA